MTPPYVPALDGDRVIPDRRAAERRLEAERRRVRRQATRALDRLLAPQVFCSPEGARVRRVWAEVERNQEFYRQAGLWLADLDRALDYADPDEVLARIDAMAAALRRTQSTTPGGDR